MTRVENSVDATGVSRCPHGALHSATWARRAVPPQPRRRSWYSCVVRAPPNLVPVVDALRLQPHVLAVYLFGSHARGEAHTDSDVDLGVVLDPAGFGRTYSVRASRGRARDSTPRRALGARRRSR